MKKLNNDIKYILILTLCFGCGSRSKEVIYKESYTSDVDKTFIEQNIKLKSENEKLRNEIFRLKSMDKEKNKDIVSRKKTINRNSEFDLNELNSEAEKLTENYGSSVKNKEINRNDELISANSQKLIGEIGKLNNLFRQLSCKIDDANRHIEDFIRFTTPFVQRGMDLSLEQIQAHIPENWHEQSKDFIYTSKIVYDELNIRLQFLPKSYLARIDLKDGSLSQRTIPLKNFGSGSLVVELPECE